ncbi:hypothetical protein AAW51_2764 [Caldimonas brevitalea]|uniref:Uncharacterized protein n=1 Tax=Caldimonas brevitalea TaxID=413882 RepID=A0A0G3BSC9_9BURK|nr:hypothetical protein AAW51_2764 [Caldimonas brevitalea]
MRRRACALMPAFQPPLSALMPPARLRACRVAGAVGVSSGQQPDIASALTVLCAAPVLVLQQPGWLDRARRESVCVA